MRDRSTRRSFLGVSVLAAAHTAMPRTATAVQAATTARSVPVKLGLASYTFREFDRAQLIGFMRQLNVSDLNAKNVKDHLPADPVQEAAALAAYTAAGIKLHAAGAISFAKSDDADMRSKFEYCRRAGVAVMVAGDPSPESLPRLERFVKEYDLRLAIHNHGPEDKTWPSPLTVLKAVQGMDPRMGCCIDVGHTVRAGVDVVDAIRQVGPRLFNVHMKDLMDFGSKESQVAVGMGKMPVRAIFEALMAEGYKGYVDLEYEVHADDPMPGVTSSFGTMRGVLAGMGVASHG